MYTVTLIKDRPPHKKGDSYGQVDRDGYLNLLDGGFIEDEFNLKSIKKKKEKKENK
jgi:hypothetical protein